MSGRPESGWDYTHCWLTRHWTALVKIAAINPTFAITDLAVNISPGATTGNTSTITVTPAGGFTGNVSLAPTISSSPAGAQYPPSLSFGSTSPVNIAGSTAKTATLTISTTAATSGALTYPKRPGASWYAVGTASFACLFLMWVPARRRRWVSMLRLLVLLVAIASTASACGGGSSGGVGGGTGASGTTAGSYTVTITGTSGTTIETGTLTFTVQ
jgi:hypothetical protein